MVPKHFTKLCLSRRAVQAKYIKDGGLCKTLAKLIVVHCD